MTAAADTKVPVSDNKSSDDRFKKLDGQIESLTKGLTDLTQKLSNTRMTGHPDPRHQLGVPTARRGEDPLTSRGFSFMKMFGILTGAINPDQAKVELDIHNRLHSVFSGDFQYSGGHRPGEKAFMAPMASSFFAENSVDRNFRTEMKSLVRHGLDGADPDEADWIRKKMMGSHFGNHNTKALSWLTEQLGGALVAPPDMGELIELLRNKEALVNAGARVVPLPPQGRLKYPRQTAASSTFWVGENKPITDSDVKVGEVTLQAKKLAVLIKAPNELIRFASPAAEALMRDDMTKSLALGLDLAGLEGLGGDTRPLGVINMQNIYRLTSSSPTSNGDALVGQDIYRMVAAVEEANAEFETFIMRPKTLYKYYQLRADAVSQGDSRGQFLFSLIREASSDFPATLAGYPVVKSTQVSQNRSKGNASNLTYVLGGMFSDLLIGMFGAIEFSATTLGDTPFVADQTWVKGILSADIQARHESAFVLLDNLDLTLSA